MFLAKIWNSASKKPILNCFWCAEISLEIEADAVKSHFDPFKLVQSDLDESYVLDLALVSDGTTIENSTEVDQALSIAEPATNDDQNILNHNQSLHTTFISCHDNDVKNINNGRKFQRLNFLLIPSC